MKDSHKTKEEFTDELALLCQRVAELEKDRGEHKLMEEALKASEERFRLIFENARDGILLADVETTKFSMGNPAICKMLGYNAEQLMDIGIEDIHPEQDLPYVKDQFLKQTRGEIDIARDIRVKRKDQSTFYAEIASYPITVDDKKYLLGIFRDITERKQAEQTLQTAHRQVQDILEFLPDATFVIDRDKKVIDITDLKRTEEQILKLNSLKEQLLGTNSLSEKLIAITEGAVEIFCADFARIWITREGDLCDHGCLHAAVTEGSGVCRDHTRCLHLMASSGRYTSTDGRHCRVPLGWYKVGRVASGEDPSFVTNDVTKDPAVHDHEWARNLGLVSFAGFRLLSADGKPIGVLALFRKQAIYPEEEKLLQDLASTSSQVILAGMAEEALRESEVKFRALFDHSPIGISIARQGTTMLLNESGLRMFGYDDGSEVAWTPQLNRIAPHRRHEMSEYMKRRERGEAVPGAYETEGIRKDGSIFHLYIQTARIQFADGPATVAFFADITRRKVAEAELGRYRDHLEDLVKERTTELTKANEQLTCLIDQHRQAEQALQASEQRYRQLLSSVTDYIFTIEIRNGRPVSTTHGQGCVAVTGYTPEDYAQKPSLWYEMVHPEDQHAVITHAENAIRGGMRDPLEHRIIHKKGTTRWVRNTMVPRYDTAGRFVACDGLISDITERRIIEQELKQTNTYLENVFENSPDAIGIVDDSGRFISWNRMAAELYGYSFEEMKGKSGFDLYADKDELQRMLVHLRQEGSVKKWEMKMKRKDGSIVPFEISIGLLKGSQNKTLGSVCVARDLSGIKEALAAVRISNEQLNQEIAERRRAEEALLKSEETLQQSEKNLRSLTSQLFTIQEEERKRISKELHDGMGQELTVLKIYLASIQNKLGEDQPSLKDDCESVLGYIDGIIEDARRLCQDLSPYLLEELGLSASLKHLFEEVCCRNGLACSLEIEEIGTYLHRRSLVAIYRIFQEALTNIVKHAGATQISLSIRKQATRMNFMVEDNGKGFDIRSVNQRAASDRGMGLFAIAERTRMLGGSLQILSQTGQGTRISFCLPIREKGKP